MSKVKICGIFRPEDVDAVNSALPDYIGFVFAESRRRVSAAKAASLRERLDMRIRAVGVFVNETIETVSEFCRSGVIDIVQLHGDEDGEYIRRLKEMCGCPVIKAIGVGETRPPLPSGADFLLFDTLSRSRGGTGRAFDWGVLEDGVRQPYFLAGGLSAGNIAEAVRRLHPYCVDVSSGAEIDGKKDSAKIEEIVRIVRGIT